MSNKWFAGNFCPSDAKCSLDEGALSPSNGPKIRTLELIEPRENPYAATVQSFSDDQRDWAKCDGQLLSIAKYSGLFSLLGTSYGGDGRVSFGLPNLQSEEGDSFYIYTKATLGK